MEFKEIYDYSKDVITWALIPIGLFIWNLRGKIDKLVNHEELEIKLDKINSAICDHKEMVNERMGGTDYRVESYRDEARKNHESLKEILSEIRIGQNEQLAVTKQQVESDNQMKKYFEKTLESLMKTDDLVDTARMQISAHEERINNLIMNNKK